jgi:hypothetical protein
MTLADRIRLAIRRLRGEHEVVVLVQTTRGVRQVRVPAGRR